MRTDRFLAPGELGELMQRCVRRPSCAFSMWGDPPREERQPAGTGSVRRGDARGGTDKPRLPVDDTSEPTPLEVAVVKILPKWPDALRAVFEYARQLSGIVLPTPIGGSGDGQVHEFR